ncbi:somatostatin-1A-like [Oncorhynchus masou masou]|uniref:somatostatin-1A-like n=1 Tax=Oncorhynchus masou masou TaxID=90313 RepID=UPI00318407F2
MLCTQLQVLLVTGGSASVLLARVSIAPHRDVLNALQRADTTKDKDLSHILLLKMLDLMTTAVGENKVLLDIMEALWVRSEVVRQLPLNQWECKAGCRNFYWKTFTSC